MVSGFTGRIGIIRRARESTTPPRARYKDVKASLSAALVDAPGEKKILTGARALFEQRSEDASLSNFRRDDAAKSLDVLNAYDKMRNKLAGYDYVAAPMKQTPLKIGGVIVPVTLNLLIHRTAKNGDGEVGGLLFRLTQSDEEETDDAASKRHEMGLFAATLVHMHVSTNMKGNRKPAYPICWSVDVQCGEVHVAPKTYAKRAADLESACKFIAAMWATA